MIWLLDTNIFIPALNGRPGIRTRINEAAASGEVVTSVLVLGELLHGAQCSERSAENIRAVETELSRIRILPVTERISRRFADLKTTLRRKRDRQERRRPADRNNGARSQRHAGDRRRRSPGRRHPWPDR